MYGMGSFDWSLNIHVWNLSRIFWYAYRFIHETFDTRMFSNVKLFIRGTFGAFCPLWPTILTCGRGENVPGIPGACATGNFTYLERCPWHQKPGDSANGSTAFVWMLCYHWLKHFRQFTCNVRWRYIPITWFLSLKKRMFSWCQCCRHWRLSLWQPLVSQAATELALWKRYLFSDTTARVNLTIYMYHWYQAGAKH